MKKLAKIIVLFLLVAVGCFGFYLYKLHALAVEGNRIFGYRCLNVNPKLITYKKTFLKLADQFNNPEWASGEQMRELLYTYNEQIREYIKAEDIWLAMEKKYMDRWDFQIIEPWYIKEGSVYQWKMYEGYRDDAKSIAYTWDHPESVTSPPDPTYVNEQRQRRDKYIKLYFEFFDYASEIRDWRKYFGYVPVPEGCTEENTTIPNTSGSINWGTDEPGATPSGVPIDPEAILV